MSKCLQTFLTHCIKLEAVSLHCHWTDFHLAAAVSEKLPHSHHIKFKMDTTHSILQRYKQIHITGGKVLAVEEWQRMTHFIFTTASDVWLFMCSLPQWHSCMPMLDQMLIFFIVLTYHAELTTDPQVGSLPTPLHAYLIKVTLTVDA